MLVLKALPVLEQIRSNVRTRSLAFQAKSGRKPKLAVVLVGNDPASVIYTTKKGDAALAAEMEHISIKFPETAKPEEVFAALQKLNNDPTVDGILIQRPLPASFKEEEVLYWVKPEKDVDAFHPENTGRLVLGLPCFRPCTPAGVLEILDHYKIPIEGKIACVVGRSSIVGKPMAALLLNRHATVLHVHSKTKDLRSITTQADILVVAAGKMGLIDATFIKPSATVIDVGIHRTPQNKVVGDVNFDSASSVASALTPVPGGVGPMTISILLQNTVFAAERSLT